MTDVRTEPVPESGQLELRRRVAELEALARVGAVVDRSELLDDVLGAALDELLGETAADRAAVLLFDDAGVMRFRAWRGLSDDYRAVVEGHSPWTRGARDPEALAISDVATAEGIDDVRTAVLREGIQALAFVPLLHQGRLVGKFMLYADRPREFRPDELRFAQTIGSHVAAASERKRAEAALLASRADLEAILGQIADGITVQDGTGALVYANDAAARIIGFGSAAEFIATPIEDVLSGFEMFDENGDPFPMERLPGRLALQGLQTEEAICYRVKATGVRRWSVVRATPVFGEHGSIRYAVNAFQDITARKLAEERLRLLAEASGLFASLDYEETLQQIPRLVVPRIADACSVWYAKDGYLHRVATHAEDPEKLAAYDQVPRRWSLTDDADTLMVSLFEAGEPVLMSDLTPDVLRTAARDERDVEAIDRVGTRSAIVLPLAAREQNFGLLTLVGFEPHRFDETDLSLAKVLATRAAVALDRALLFRESEEGRVVLEFLAEAGELFASSLDLDEILRRIARVIVPRIADACNIYLSDGDAIKRVAFANAQPELERIMARMPDRYDLGPGAPSVFRDIYVKGEPLLATELGGELVAALERLGLDRDAFREVGSRSMMFVPFVSRGQTVGVMTIGAREPGRYGDRDLALALELARRAATAIENAQNYERAQARASASQALEFVGDGVLLVDRDGVAQLWNPAAEAITGLPAADVVGRPVADAIPGWAELQPHIPISLRPETLPLGVERELWVSISGVAFGEGTVYAFRDVTDEHAVERMKTDFISTVSHELRTPLAAIYGAAMTVRREGAAVDARREELIALIGSEAERLARTINDVLWASRLESGALELSIESFDAGALLGRVVAARQTHLPENLRLELDVDGDTPRIAADTDKVRQVLENLVDNAVKYSPDGGTIRASAAPAGRFVRLTIADEGLGIPVAERERIFSKFYRLDPDLTRGVGGTGLGLYISRALVQRMDGRIHVEGNSSGGSTFVVELPAAQ